MRLESVKVIMCVRLVNVENVYYCKLSEPRWSTQENRDESSAKQ